MTNLVLTEGQESGDVMVGKLLGQDQVRVGKLTGYAGTGKTTLIGILAKKYGTPVVLTPTGKAALRVREVTGLPAITIHRFLYDVEEDERGKLVFNLKSSWSEEMTAMEGKWVLIDEASMVGQDLWDDLIRVATKVKFHILLMGDLFQLPPVSKSKDAEPFAALGIETPFSVNLTEVVRQALDSPIIQASMLIRSGKPEHEAMALLQPVGADKLIETIVDGRSRGGTAICFTNQERHALNNAVRVSLGYLPNTIYAGEPILITQNNYRIDRYNGEVVTFMGWRQPPEDMFSKAVVDRFTNGHLSMHFGVGEIENDLVILSPEEVGGACETEKIGVSAIRRSSKYWYRDHAERVYVGDDRVLPHLHCSYGNALTCHKSQGSEWPEVLVVIEGTLRALRGVERRRWLYTAMTRGKTTVKYCYVG